MGLFAADDRRCDRLCKSYIVDINVVEHGLMTLQDVPSLSPYFAEIRIMLRIQWIRLHLEKSLFEENCEPNLEELFTETSPSGGSLVV